MLLAFKVTKENNSKEVNTAREGDSRVSQARNLCLLSQSRHLGGGVKDKRSEVTGGGRQLVMRLQDTTEEGTAMRASRVDRWKTQGNDRREGPQHQQENTLNADRCRGDRGPCHLVLYSLL